MPVFWIYLSQNIRKFCCGRVLNVPFLKYKKSSVSWILEKLFWENIRNFFWAGFLGKNIKNFFREKFWGLRLESELGSPIIHYYQNKTIKFCWFHMFLFYGLTLNSIHWVSYTFIIQQTVVIFIMTYCCNNIFIHAFCFFMFIIVC